MNKPGASPDQPHPMNRPLVVSGHGCMCRVFQWIAPAEQFVSTVRFTMSRLGQRPREFRQGRLFWAESLRWIESGISRLPRQMAGESPVLVLRYEFDRGCNCHPQLASIPFRQRSSWERGSTNSID